jgi:hypothetical protein
VQKSAQEFENTVDRSENRSVNECQKKAIAKRALHKQLKRKIDA